MFKNKKNYQVASPYFSQTDINWIKSKVKNILTGKLSTGPFTEKFEKNFAKFIGTKYAVFLNSCTSALEIAIKSLNLKDGEEVIVPIQSFIADGMCVTSQKGTIVFANINPETFCLDLKEIKKLYSKKTRAVILVYFGGYMPIDTLAIKNFCKQKNILLVEDCAHAIGSEFKGKQAGSIGDVGCYSFFATKTITTAEGGMLTTNNKKIYKLALSLRERGRDWDNNKFEIYKFDWRTCRVPEFSAVMGINQFSKIHKIISHRNKITNIYDREINKSSYLKSLKKQKNQKLSIWKHITIIKNSKIKREALQNELRKKYGININWAYDPPLHLQTVYKNLYKKKFKRLEKTVKLMSKHFHLPLHMNISVSDAKYISECLISCCEKFVKR